MKSSVIALGLVSALSNSFAAQDVLNVKISIDGTVSELRFNLMPTIEMLSQSTMKDISFERSSGDCSGRDLSKISNSYKEGFDVHLLSSPEVDGSRMFQLNFVTSKLTSFRSHQFGKKCSVIFANTGMFNSSPSFSLKRGEVLEVLTLKDGQSSNKDISLKVDWR